MKKLVFKFIILILMLSPFLLSAQPGGEKRKQIEAERVGVYTRVLNLSTEEAKKFWPVFNQMQTEREKLREEKQKLHKEMVEKYASLSDKEIEKNLDQFLALEQKELDIKKKYMEEFKKAIPVKKVALIHNAEREFKRQLLQRFRGEREHMEE